MRLYGNFEMHDFAEDAYYSDDKINFIVENKDKKRSKMDKEFLTDWAIALNSPWSQTNVNYVIEMNCKDSYTPIPKSEPQWRCRFVVVGYEGMTATCIGYGNTEDEAFMDCRNLLKYLQEKYNPNDEAI